MQSRVIKGIEASHWILVESKATKGLERCYASWSSEKQNPKGVIIKRKWKEWGLSALKRNRNWKIIQAKKKDGWKGCLLESNWIEWVRKNKKARGEITG